MTMKVTNTHGTRIPLAEKIRTAVLPNVLRVKKLTTGIIKPARTRDGKQFVQIKDYSPGSLLLIVRGSTAVQQLRIFYDPTDEQAVKLGLARSLRNHEIAIKFGKSAEGIR